MGWLTAHTCPFVIVMAFLRKHRPLVFIQECTWHFDAAIFKELLPMYRTRSVVFSPVDVGDPP